MGWFDKKSWQLRRKIKDLQAELAVAENEGKYVVEQGLFFAELQEMGDATMMVLGTADHVESGEDAVVRSFFDRNGFTVERLRLDKSHKALVDLEVIPPEELTRYVARLLKNSGYKMIDDSEHERPYDGAEKIFPLSALVRSISWLFADQVQTILVNTPLKMNMEGNRLLHWLPMMKECLDTKVSAEVINETRRPYIEGFHHYYARFGHLDPNPPEEPVKEAELPVEESVPEENSSFPPVEELHARIKTTASGSNSNGVEPVFSGYDTELNRRAVKIDNNEDNETSAGLALARIYKSLIGAQRERPVINSELVLQEILKFYDATSVCLILPDESGRNHSIHAGAGRSLCVGENETDKLPVSSTVISECISTKKFAVVHNAGNMDPSASLIFNSIESAAAAPIMREGKVGAVLYIDRRDNLNPFTSGELRSLEKFTDVFKEFPDLLLSVS